MLSLNIMRRCDSWLGWPLATAVGLWPRRQRPLPARPRVIVVVKLAGMGSLLVCDGVLRALKAAQPEARLMVVALNEAAAAARLLPAVDATLALSTASPLALLRDAWRVWRALRRARPDVIADIEYFSKLSTVFCALCGARHRLGFRLPARWRERLLDSGIAFREDIHFRDNVARLLQPLGVDYRHPPTARLTPPAAARAAAAALLDAGQGARWMAVNPHATALCAQRRWPLERFAAVTAALLERHAELRVVIPGAAAERARAEALRALLPAELRERARVLAGRTDLPTLAAVLAGCRLVLTNDTGILHLAAAVGAPLVGLFGPESPLRYGPIATAPTRVISADVPCGPCLSYMNHKRAPCADDATAACMAAIAVETVRAACEELLEDEASCDRARAGV
jgi:ADP-heptose:LPS heptosyltransferase